MASLTFALLREANLRRLPLFRNGQGVVIHKPDGSDWSTAQWLQATMGELGELANLMKKCDRNDFPVEKLEEVQRELGKECADVVTYLDILAYRLGVDLGEATRLKWNEVSDRVKVPLHILQVGTDFQIVNTSDPAWSIDAAHAAPAMVVANVPLSDAIGNMRTRILARYGSGGKTITGAKLCDEFADNLDQLIAMVRKEQQGMAVVEGPLLKLDVPNANKRTYVAPLDDIDTLKAKVGATGLKGNIMNLVLAAAPPGFDASKLDWLGDAILALLPKKDPKAKDGFGRTASDRRFVEHVLSLGEIGDEQVWTPEEHKYLLGSVTAFEEGLFGASLVRENAGKVLKIHPPALIYDNDGTWHAVQRLKAWVKTYDELAGRVTTVTQHVPHAPAPLAAFTGAVAGTAWWVLAHLYNITNMTQEMPSWHARLMIAEAEANRRGLAVCWNSSDTAEARARDLEKAISTDVILKAGYPAEPMVGTPCSRLGCSGILNEQGKCERCKILRLDALGWPDHEGKPSQTPTGPYLGVKDKDFPECVHGLPWEEICEACAIVGTVAEIARREAEAKKAT